jgi:hypothetical protein
MLYYIDCILTNQQRAELIDKGVDFTELTLGTEAYHRHGVAFSREDGNAVVEVLGLLWEEGRSHEELYTPQGEWVEGYYIARLVPLPTPARSLLYRNGRMPRGDEEELYDVSQLRLARGAVLEEFEDGYEAYRHIPGVLFINTGSIPDVENGVGFRCAGWFKGRNACFMVCDYPERLSPEYRPIKDEESSVLAYFRGDSDGGTLWLTFKPNQLDRDEIGRLLVGYVLKVVAHWMHPELGEPPSYSECAKLLERENFIRIATRRLEREIDQIGVHTGEALEEVQEVRARLVRALRTASLLRRRAGELTSRERSELLKETVEQLEREFDALEASPDIESIEFGEDWIRGVTRPIQIRYGGLIYEMGHYTIFVNETKVAISSADGLEQYSENRDRHVCHPQIFSDGSACFGNASETIAKMQAEQAYSTLLPFLVVYLETGYNPADHELSIEKFNVPTHPDPEGEEDRARTEQRAARRATRRRDRPRQPQA